LIICLPVISVSTIWKEGDARNILTIKCRKRIDFENEKDAWLLNVEMAFWDFYVGLLVDLEISL